MTLDGTGDSTMTLLDVTTNVLREHGITHLVTVANFETAGLRSWFEDDPDRAVTAACREGEAGAIASGLVAGGRRAVLSMENLGLFECLDTLRGLPCAMDIPLPIFIGYHGRGAGEEDAFELVGGLAGNMSITGAWTEPILNSVAIPNRVLLPDASEEEARAALTEAVSADGPFVILVDSLNKE
jgi:sulfopyruvate decarboxylase subunit alpha